MARSMTGYGRGEGSYETCAITVELKAVNHRYFEFLPKLPRDLSFMEDAIKKQVATKISRGKVDMFITLKSAGLGETVVTLNENYAGPYIDALKTLAEKYSLKDDISVMTVARNQDIFTFSKAELDEEALSSEILSIVDKAVEAFISMRKAEGKRLVEDVCSRVDKIKELLTFIEERSPETVKEYRIKLEERMKELLGDVNIDEQRLITETGIIADKLAVCEETVRLRSHMSQLTELLPLDEPIGRKLDFIVQEMNRETNTIGSKAQDIEITKRVVEIKSEIEKIREQIQNIE